MVSIAIGSITTYYMCGNIPYCHDDGCGQIIYCHSVSSLQLNIVAMATCVAIHVAATTSEVARTN